MTSVILPSTTSQPFCWTKNLLMLVYSVLALERKNLANDILPSNVNAVLSAVALPSMPPMDIITVLTGLTYPLSKASKDAVCFSIRPFVVSTVDESMAL